MREKDQVWRTKKTGRNEKGLRLTRTTGDKTRLSKENLDRVQVLSMALSTQKAVSLRCPKYPESFRHFVYFVFSS